MDVGGPPEGVGEGALAVCVCQRMTRCVFRRGGESSQGFSVLKRMTSCVLGRGRGSRGMGVSEDDVVCDVEGTGKLSGMGVSGDNLPKGLGEGALREWMCQGITC